VANNSVSHIKKLQAEAQALLQEKGLESVDETRLHPFKKFVHFWVLVGRSFVRNRCLIRSSALAYTTLLALIPLLAVGLGVSTSLLNSSKEQTKEMISKLVDQLAPQLGNVADNQEEKATTRRELIEKIQSMIANVHSGALGVTGTVALLFVAIGLLSTIEATFNDIWGVERGRNWFARIIQYWAVITLGPLVIVFVMGLAIGAQFQAVQTFIKDTPVIGGLFFRMIPFFVLCGSFTLLYALMPNTKVQWKAALIGGFVAGLLWIVNGNSNALFASRVVSANKIYGPLATIPIFLFGLYLSWVILLFGSQVAYAFQNLRAYVQEKQAEVVNQRGREFVALRVMTLVARRFHRGEKPPSPVEIADELAVPSRLVSHIVQPLLHAKLLMEVNTPDTGYSPARPLDRVTYEDILQALRVGRGQMPPTRDEFSRDLVRGTFEDVQKAEEQVAKAVTLQALVDRIETVGAAAAAAG
jgi:membrane protein